MTGGSKKKQKIRRINNYILITMTQIDKLSNNDPEIRDKSTKKIWNYFIFLFLYYKF